MEEKEVYVIPRPHWSETADRQVFTQTMADLGIDGAAVPSILGVERVGEFDGSVEEAKDLLLAYAAQHRQDIRAGLEPQKPKHSEAQAIAFVDAFLPDGSPIHITSRQGATAADIVSTTLALVDAMEILKAFGVRTTRPRPIAPVRVAASVAAAKPVDPATDFWKNAKRYIGPGKPFGSRNEVANWLSQFAMEGGYNWRGALQALYGFDVTASAPVEEDRGEQL